MIKSSDKAFQNTYRILRVLSNQDYLAVDQHDSRFIFSEAKMTAKAEQERAISISKSPDSKEVSHLLRHREIIEIDQLQYAVFEVGQSDVLWAPLQNKKKLDNEVHIAWIVRQSIQDILRQLIWMGCSQASKYMDIRNFWIINEELFLLLLPRQKKVGSSMKKSEKHSQSKTLQLVMQSQKTLMRQFALILWQVCFQNKDYELTAHTHSSTRQILGLMIRKEIGFEQLLGYLGKQKAVYSSERKGKFKTITHQDIFHRRKTLSSIQKSNKSAQHYLNHSNIQRRGIVDNETAINRTQMQDSQLSSETKWQSLCPQRRSASQETHNLRFRPAKYQHRLSTQSSTKDTIHYESWLQKKKFSHEVREKLIKNSEIAMKKFIETIQKERQETSQQRVVDKAMKEKVLSRVLKFKNAFKDKYSSALFDCSRFEEVRATEARKLDAHNEEAQESQPSSQSQQQPFDFKLTRISEDLTLPQSNNTLQPHRKQTKEEYQEKLPQIPTFPIKSQSQLNKYTQGNMTAKQEAQGNSMKTEKNKMKRIDIVDSISNQAELDLEIVQLPQCKSKANPKQQRPTPSKQATAADVGKADEHLHQFLMMINTLGDITVRAVKSKDYLSDLNWRQATYYLYERFEVERKLFAAKLASSKPTYRQHRKVDIIEEQAFMGSLARQNLFRQVDKQNQQIAATLAKLGLKLLEEEKMESKIEYYIRNRQKLAVKNQEKLRRQLSKLLVGCIINEFDYVYEQKIKTPQVVHFLFDCIFGMYVIAELDGMLPSSRLIALDQYKQYPKDLARLKPMVDYIDGIYFPNEEAGRQTR